MDCATFRKRWARCESRPGADARAHLASCPACAEFAATETHASGADAGFSRRGVIGAGVAGLLMGAAPAARAAAEDGTRFGIPVGPDAPVEYIVVGSGAGGGPLACNLARAGHKVVLFEAGGANDAEDVAQIPFLSGATTEDARIRWDYYVRHYATDSQQQRDTKYYPDPDKDGVWYPRVGSLGGCTVHSFMVEIYPSDSDWDYIAAITGDTSWEASRMRTYYIELERCRYARDTWPFNPARHGFHGWQPAEIADSSVYVGDPQVERILEEAQNVVQDPRFTIDKLLTNQLDPNDWRIRNNREGIFDIPLFTANGRRFGPRQYIRQTATKLPNNLIVKTHCLVTRVLFEGRTARGVEYLEGEHLYRADPNAVADAAGMTRRLAASREVILAAGTFNTPQLLKLSGIGPKAELASHGISTIVDLPGVGRNLQDRSEVGVVTDLKNYHTFTSGCFFQFAPGDPCYDQLASAGTGPYAGYGAVGGIFKTTDTAKLANRPDPDLLISIALTRFKGYYHGYSQLDLSAPDAAHQMTWLILKGHTLNRGGTVALRSADPRDTPLINFHYFEEGTDRRGEDLSSVVDGIEFAREINARLGDIVAGEVVPGPAAQSRAEIAQFVRDEAWGHHASCSCRMGGDGDPLAVVDSRFRVFGTRNLRIVDASVFPRIPGYFVLLPIYMISQKASHVILEDAVAQAEAPVPVPA